jgi:hypothetical protein
MTEPITTPVVPVPTQVQFPWKATLRTIIAMIISCVVVLILIIPVGLDVFAPYMSADVQGKATYILGVLVTISAFFTRIMAISQVNALLTKIGLGATNS